VAAADSIKPAQSRLRVGFGLLDWVCFHTWTAKKSAHCEKQRGPLGTIKTKAPQCQKRTLHARLCRRDRLVVGDAVPRDGRGAEGDGAAAGLLHHRLDGGAQDVEAAEEVGAEGLRGGEGGGGWM